MTTLNITLPDELQSFIDHRVSECGHGSSSEYILDLIRRDRQGLDRFRQLLLEGALSPIEGPADAEYFDSLRRRVTGDEQS